jgi:hypothetical protein
MVKINKSRGGFAHKNSFSTLFHQKNIIKSHINYTKKNPKITFKKIKIN